MPNLRPLVCFGRRILVVRDLRRRVNFAWNQFTNFPTTGRNNTNSLVTSSRMVWWQNWCEHCADKVFGANPGQYWIIFSFCSNLFTVVCIFFSLQDRQLVRNLCRSGQRPNYPETDEALVPIFRKLHSQGITEEDEDKLLFLREVILKLHRAKTR